MRHVAGSRRTTAWKRWSREVFLTVAALLGVLCASAAVATSVFDVTPLVFRSGSMSPAIQTGALALSHTVPAEDLRPGDVVSVPTQTGVRVTHRIETVEVQAGLARLQLKGDANPVADAAPYFVRTAERVYVDVPYVGYVVAAASSRTGTFVGGLLVGLALLLAFGRRPAPVPDAPVPTTGERTARGSGRHRARHGRPAHRRGVPVSGVALGCLAALVTSQANVPEMTLAAWTDSATTTSGDLKADTVGAPTVACSSGLLVPAVLTWPAVEGATSYTLHYGTNGSSTLAVSAASRTHTFNNGSSGTAWVVANRAFGSPVTTTWTSGTSNKFTYSVATIVLSLSSTCTAA